jgi:hypothetical protein
MDVYRIHLAQDSLQLRAFVNTKWTVDSKEGEKFTD